MFNRKGCWESVNMISLCMSLIKIKEGWKNFQVFSMGFKPMTCELPVQCSDPLSYETTQMWAGQFVGLMCSCERNNEWRKYLWSLVVRCIEEISVEMAHQFEYHFFNSGFIIFHAIALELLMFSHPIYSFWLNSVKAREK